MSVLSGGVRKARVDCIDQFAANSQVILKPVLMVSSILNLGLSSLVKSCYMRFAKCSGLSRYFKKFTRLKNIIHFKTLNFVAL